MGRIGDWIKGKPKIPEDKVPARGKYFFQLGDRNTLSVLACPYCKLAEHLDHSLDIQKENPRSVWFSCEACGTEFDLAFSRLYCGRCGGWSKKFSVRVGLDSDTIPEKDEPDPLVINPFAKPKAYHLSGICMECDPEIVTDPRTGEKTEQRGGGGHFSFGERTG